MVKGNSKMIKASKSDEEFLRRVQGLEKKNQDQESRRGKELSLSLQYDPVGQISLA